MCHLDGRVCWGSDSERRAPDGVGIGRLANTSESTGSDGGGNRHKASCLVPDRRHHGHVGGFADSERPVTVQAQPGTLDALNHTASGGTASSTVPMELH
jgi:hypothetical protein